MYWPAGVKHGVDLQNMKSGLFIIYLKYHDPKKIYEEYKSEIMNTIKCLKPQLS